MKMRMFNRKKLLLMLAVLALPIALATPNIARAQLADDSSWSTTELVSSDFAYHGWSQIPSLGVGIDGTVHIAWMDSPDLFDTEIYYKRWVPDTGWTETEVISNDTESGRSSSPSLAVGPKGTVHIAWHDHTDYGDSGSDTDIFYKRLDPGYTRWTTTKVISTESTSASGFPSLAVGSDGRVYIAWEDYTDIKGSGPDADIFLKVTDVFPWNGVVTVVSTESTEDSHNPSLAVGPFRRVHIAWDDYTDYDDSGTDRDIFYKWFAPGYTDLTTTEVVSTESTNDSSNPSLALGFLDLPSIAWQDLTDYDDSGTDRDIFYKQKVLRRIFPDPSPPFWTTTEVVSTESTLGSISPSLAVGSDGKKHIAWTELADLFIVEDHVLYAVPGTGWTTTEMVSPDDLSLSGIKYISSAPSLAVDAYGTVHIAWQDESPDIAWGGWGSDIFYRKRWAPTPTGPVTYECSDPLPLYVQGTPGNSETLHITVPHDLSMATEAWITVELYDTEETDEGDLYVNGYGPVDLPLTGNQNAESFEIDVPLSYLASGVNEFTFAYSRSSSSWGYEVRALSLTVIFP